jgi:hypothetical protein
LTAPECASVAAAGQLDSGDRTIAQSLFAAAATYEVSAVVLAFRLPGDLTVDLPVDFSKELAQAIRSAVRSALDHIAGVWKVAVQRSMERGRWRIELRGVTGRHIWTVCARPEMLPQIVAQRLEVFIWASATLHQTRARRSPAPNRTST